MEEGQLKYGPTNAIFLKHLTERQREADQGLLGDQWL